MNVAEHDSILPPALIRAYRCAQYQVQDGAGFMLAVDAPSPALAAVMSSHGAASALFITAWNPWGVVLGAEENRVRQQRLRRDLQARGLLAIAGRGSDASGNWDGEDSLLVLAVNLYTACELGRRHEQNAVLWSGADAIPRLLLLR